MKRSSGIRAFMIWLLVSVMTVSVPVQASISQKNTAQAIASYAAWIRREVKETGGSKKLLKAPGNTSGDLSVFKKILKTYIRDGIVSSKSWGSGRAFSTARKALIYMWSLNYKNNPYVDYNILINWEWGGVWYGYIADDTENALKYQSDKSGSAKKAAKKFKADFKKQLTAYRNKYGSLNQARKVAAINNYVAEKLSYYYGAIPYKGTRLWAGGDLYTAYVTGYGSCVDYSNLFHLLCQANGIESHIAMGRVREDSASEWGYHQWNIVKVNNRYYYIDPTWSDCGSRTSLGTGEFFFAKDPDDMYYQWEIFMVV